ncbi:MAG: FtsW/RodA/SpoVE family cell cycle protein [Deltaproteobacteria bacterium]|nr:FtsW/RodA/SpoVE family cell cycle protein [Deltaproteobacteria bacterium]
MDKTLIGTFTSIGLLNLLGILSVMSATSDVSLDNTVSGFAIRQSIYSILGFFIAILLSRVQFNLSLWRTLANVSHAVLTMLTIFVLFSEPIKGASRWLDFVFFSFQPAEFLKISTISVLSLLCVSQIETKIKLFLVFLTGILSAVCVAFQPDLSTSLLFALYSWTAGYLCSQPKRYVFWSFLIVLLIAPIFWELFLEPYQRRRIIALLRGDDPLGSNWQVLQSLIAVGSGGIFGKGYLGGTQSRFELLPERHTDFVFSVFCEEFGFFGATFVVSLFLFVLFLLLRIAMSSSSELGKAFTGLIVVKLGVEIVLNILMTLGLAPVTGTALPFFSYGGSSLISNYIAVGLCLSFNKKSKMF